MNNQNKVAISLQENWASKVSEYILLRRQQTHSAYKATDSTHATMTHAESQQIGRIEDSGLFSALFVMLATHLEEGHTVLTIETAEKEQPLQGQIKGEVVSLYSWQQQLIERLAAPILALIDTQVVVRENVTQQTVTREEAGSIPELSIFDLLDILFTKQAQLWAQLTLSNHEKERLLKRFNSVVAFYQLLKNTDFSAFVQLIDEHALFANVDADIDSNGNKNSLSKNNRPVTCKKTNRQNNKEESSLTFWLHRTWQAEFNLANNISMILNQQITPLELSLPENLNPQQVIAINVANDNAFSIITGGPGTGKTYTVAQLVIALQQAPESRGDMGKSIRFSTESASLALAAPTGKAAQRMQESLQSAIDTAGIELQLQEAKTIHRLLGIGRTGKPRYDANNPLGEDIIIVDEASMLGVELANYLVSAVKPGARLILLGDANQLAAVDAGAVLADLCRIPVLQPIHVELMECS